MATCSNCGLEIPSGQEVFLKPKNRYSKSVTICKDCEAKAEQIFQAETEEVNLVGGLTVGALAGIVGSLIWYAIVVVTNYQLGIIAIAIGALIGQAVYLGAGRKRGRALQLGSVLIALVSMVLSEYLIIRHFVVIYMAGEGVTDIPLLLPPDMIVQLLVEGLKASPVDLAFWAIAVWEAFLIPGKKKLPRLKTKPATAV